MLLDGKKLLLTGVLSRSSIAYAVARLAQEQGAELILTGVGKAMALTESCARRLPSPAAVLEMDANDPGQIAAVAEEVGRRFGHLDGFLHSIAYAPEDALGGNFLKTGWDSVATALRTSAYSLQAISVALRPFMAAGEGGAGGAVVGMDFDASVAWPIYDWMGVAKAALESCARYLARDLGPDGIRVNLVSAGPLKTTAAKGIPGFQVLADGWGKRAPLGWDVTDPVPAARSVIFLLSDWSQGISGEILHVDGGYHALGADIRP